MIPPWFKIGVALQLIVAILLMQGYLSLLSPFLVTTAHAPLDDCALHKCGCDPDIQKRKTCCCHPERAHGADGGQHDGNSWEVVIRAAQCNGDVGSPGLSVVKCETLLPATACLSPPADMDRQFVFVPRSLPGLIQQPPTPPPRRLSLA